MNKPLKIAQVTNLYESVPPHNKGGLEHMVYYLTEELVSMGHDVTLFGTADSKTSAKLVPLWPKAISLDDNISHKDQQTSAVWAISEVFKHALEFDVIHDHTYFTAGHFAGLINTPVVSTIHHPVSLEKTFVSAFPESYKPYLDLQFGHYNDITSVTVSKFQNIQFETTLGRKSHTIHNGIPLHQWQSPNLGVGSYFAFLGYISGNKGVYEAIQSILPTNETLKIAGPIDDHDQNSKQYFAEKVEPYIDGKQIQYLGGLHLQEKQELLRNAKATLMPVQWDEPFGLVAIESLAMGTPVIAWNRGALPEIIEDGKSGFLINSVNQMSSKINAIDTLSRNDARERYESHFTARIMAQKYEMLYKSLVKKS